MFTYNWAKIYTFYTSVIEPLLSRLKQAAENRLQAIKKQSTFRLSLYSATLLLMLAHNKYEYESCYCSQAESVRRRATFTGTERRGKDTFTEDFLRQHSHNVCLSCSILERQNLRDWFCGFWYIWAVECKKLQGLRERFSDRTETFQLWPQSIFKARAV